MSTHSTPTRRRIAGAAAAAVVAGLGAVAGGAAPASAGSCTGDLCGGLSNASNSARSIGYTLQWRTSSNPTIDGYVAKGQTKGGRGSGYDIDGMYIPSGCVGSPTYGGSMAYTPGWWKIADVSTFAITLYC